MIYLLYTMTRKKEYKRTHHRIHEHFTI